MSKNIEICKAEEVGAQVLDIRTTAERQTVAALNAAFGLAIPLPAAEPGEITELPAAVSAHDRQLLAQPLGKPEPAATLSTTDPLATFVATLTRELYLHFAARTADYLPADFPAWFPHDDRNLAHLLQAVQSLSPRKISNGGATNDGIPDGMSLAHILGDSSVVVTKLEDDNKGWTWNRALPSIFGSLTKLRLSCSYIVGMTTALPATPSDVEFPELIAYGQNGEVRGAQFIYNNPNVTELTFPKTTNIAPGFSYDTASENAFIASCSALRKVTFPELLEFGKPLSGHGTYAGDYGSLIHSCANLEEVLMPKWTGVRNWRIIRNCPKVWKVVLGNIQQNVPILYTDRNYPFTSCVKLRHLEFAGVQVSLDLSSWNPDAETIAHQDFLPNFKTYIALRLTSNGSGKTLTLSQAVRNAIHAAESTYGIEDIIVNQKHWTLSPAPSA